MFIIKLFICTCPFASYAQDSNRQTPDLELRSIASCRHPKDGEPWINAFMDMTTFPSPTLYIKKKGKIEDLYALEKDLFRNTSGFDEDFINYGFSSSIVNAYCLGSHNNAMMILGQFLLFGDQTHSTIFYYDRDSFKIERIESYGRLFPIRVYYSKNKIIVAHRDTYAPDHTPRYKIFTRNFKSNITTVESVKNLPDYEYYDTIQLPDNFVFTDAIPLAPPEQKSDIAK